MVAYVALLCTHQPVYRNPPETDFNMQFEVHHFMSHVQCIRLTLHENTITQTVVIDWNYLVLVCYFLFCLNLIHFKERTSGTVCTLNFVIIFGRQLLEDR